MLFHEIIIVVRICDVLLKSLLAVVASDVVTQLCSLCVDGCQMDVNFCQF